MKKEMSCPASTCKPTVNPPLPALPVSYPRRFSLAPLALLVSALALVPAAWAHPVPDLPIQAFFEADGSCLIRVEVDPRCFAADPEAEPFLQHWVLEASSEAEKGDLEAKAVALMKRAVELRFEPLGRVEPEFAFRFTGQGNKPLRGKEDPVMVTGEWRTKVPAGLEGYRVKALPGEQFSVVVVNHLRGKPVERVHVLFPGETSYLLDLTGLTAALPDGPVPGAVGAEGGGGATFLNLLRQGFVHVLPKGWDHILFVLGLFLLSRNWKPLVLQVTTFTVAHTITLAMAALGVVQVPSRPVESIIAGSIVVVALENLFRPVYTHWRLLVVFAFGLVHGLGFAGVFGELGLTQASLVTGLLGFNVGVEVAQLAVIALAFLATFWIRDVAVYRRFVVVPGSILIAVLGGVWLVERVFG